MVKARSNPRIPTTKKIIATEKALLNVSGPSEKKYREIIKEINTHQSNIMMLTQSGSDAGSSNDPCKDINSQIKDLEKENEELEEKIKEYDIKVQNDKATNNEAITDNQAKTPEEIRNSEERTKLTAEIKILEAEQKQFAKEQNNLWDKEEPIFKDVNDFLNKVLEYDKAARRNSGQQLYVTDVTNLEAHINELKEFLNSANKIIANKPIKNQSKQDDSKQGNSEQDNPEQGNSEQGNSEQDNPEQDNSKQAYSEQDDSKQGNSEQGYSQQGNSNTDQPYEVRFFNYQRIYPIDITKCISLINAVMINNEHRNKSLLTRKEKCDLITLKEKLRLLFQEVSDHKEQNSWRMTTHKISEKKRALYLLDKADAKHQHQKNEEEKQANLKSIVELNKDRDKAEDLIKKKESANKELNNLEENVARELKNNKEQWNQIMRELWASIPQPNLPKSSLSLKRPATPESEQWEHIKTELQLPTPQPTPSKVRPTTVEGPVIPEP